MINVLKINCGLIPYKCLWGLPFWKCDHDMFCLLKWHSNCISAFFFINGKMMVKESISLSFRSHGWLFFILTIKFIFMIYIGLGKSWNQFILKFEHHYPCKPKLWLMIFFTIIFTFMHTQKLNVECHFKVNMSHTRSSFLSRRPIPRLSDGSMDWLENQIKNRVVGVHNRPIECDFEESDGDWHVRLHRMDRIRLSISIVAWNAL